jgi:hypothetical protein
MRPILCILLLLSWSLQASPDICEPPAEFEGAVLDLLASANKKEKKSSCNVIRSSQEYWFCVALEEENCELVRPGDDYWYCQAMVTQNCQLARSDKHLWMCEGLKSKNCELVRGTEDYWFCQGILQSNCGLVKGAAWRCEGLLAPINKLLDKKVIKKPVELGKVPWWL